MAPPPKNRELYVVQYPDGREITVPTPRMAVYKTLFGPIGTIACAVKAGHKTLLARRGPDPLPFDIDHPTSP